MKQTHNRRGIKINFNPNNQTFVIIFLGASLLLSIYMQTPDAITTGLIGALAGICMDKVITHNNNVGGNNNETDTDGLAQPERITEQ